MSDPQTRFKLTLHYDGGAFRGWQVQPGKPTVQGAIQNAVSRLTGEHRTVVGSGRTDTGVHATGQVAAVTMSARWTATELGASAERTASRHDPGAGHQGGIRELPPAHRRGGAQLRVPDRHRPGRRLPLPPPLVPALCRKLDLDAAARAARLFPGEHEFRAFAKSGQPQALLATLAGVAASASKMAYDIRLLSHLREIEEPFEKE